jgi:Kef-type K+ transport system membrane component KefB
MGNTTVTALFLALGIIILASRLGGSLARRFDQPRVLGELLVGVLLGPTLLNVMNSEALGLAGTHLDEVIHQLAELGVLLLMFNVGLEVHIGELAKVGRVAVIAGVIGALLPVALAVPVVMLFGYTWEPALFVGVTLAATSVSISAQVLLEIGVLRTKVGNGLLATALVDDVVAILLVSLAIAITGPSGEISAGSMVGIVGRMAVYLVVAFLLAWFVLPRLANWVYARPSVAQSYGVPALALAAALVFGWSAEHFGGVATITGAFIAGVGLSRTHDGARRQIETAVANIAYAFLVPVFFVSVGLGTDLRGFPLDALPFAAAVLLVAVVSKIVGCGLGGYWGGFNRRESFQLGVCMISRGEVGLIIASLGVTSGIFDRQHPTFASLFLVILLTTVLTPPLVRRVFQSAPAAEEPIEEPQVTPRQA